VGEHRHGGECDPDERHQRGERGFQTHPGMVAGRPYTPEVPRWLAVVLGCITALGMQALFSGLVGQTLGSPSPLFGYLVLFAALALGGFVTGHLVGRAHILYGAVMAIVFILVTTTVQATAEAIVAFERGLGALPPIDFVQLTVVDIVSMTGASVGGWVASRT
jgi:hypothetical protein